MKNSYRWLEIKMRPKKDGLHDSGYRHIQIVGVYYDADGEEQRDELHQWSDHIVFDHFTSEYQGVSLDFTADGVMRIMPWGSRGRWESRDTRFFLSSAMFRCIQEERT